MTLGQPVVVTQGTFKDQIGEIVNVDLSDTMIDVRFEDGSTLGFYADYLKQISPLNALARMVDYERG